MSTRFSEFRIEGKFRGIHVACGGKTAEAAPFEVLLLNVVLGRLRGLAKEIALRTSKPKGHGASVKTSCRVTPGLQHPSPLEVVRPPSPDRSAGAKAWAAKVSAFLFGLSNSLLITSWRSSNQGYSVVTHEAAVELNGWIRSRIEVCHSGHPGKVLLVLENAGEEVDEGLEGTDQGA